MKSRSVVSGVALPTGGQRGPYRTAERSVALLYGIACHSLFVLGISAMIHAIATGMTGGLGWLDGGAAWAANALLALQFPLIHSWLLSDRGRAVLDRLAPLGLGRDLGTTSYAAIASLQLLATFVLWSPTRTVWWAAEGAARGVSVALHAGSWLLLLKTMVDAGLDLQSGARGWWAVVRNRRPRWRPFSTTGCFRFTRQPIYVAFFLILWTGPVWSPDRLLLAVIWSLYCIFGPLLKERRCLRFEGERFRRYQSVVPYWLPTLRPARLPAAPVAPVGSPEP